MSRPMAEAPSQHTTFWSRSLRDHSGVRLREKLLLGWACALKAQNSEPAIFTRTRAFRFGARALLLASDPCMSSGGRPRAETRLRFGYFDGRLCFHGLSVCPSRVVADTAGTGNRLLPFAPCSARAASSYRTNPAEESRCRPVLNRLLSLRRITRRICTADSPGSRSKDCILVFWQRPIPVLLGRCCSASSFIQDPLGEPAEKSPRVKALYCLRTCALTRCLVTYTSVALTPSRSMIRRTGHSFNT